MLINIHDAKAQFSKIINQAIKGEDVVIVCDGKPLIRLVPYKEEIQVRKGGQFRDLMHIRDDFDELLPSGELKDFYEDEE